MSTAGDTLRVFFPASGRVRLHVPQAAAQDARSCLVAVHGYAQPLDAFFAYARSLAPGAVVVMPEGPMSFYRRRRAEDGTRGVAHAWIAELPRRASDHRNDAYLAATLDAVNDEVPIDPDRTILLGFSQGVGVAMHFLLQEPSRAAGLIGLAGGLTEAYRDQLTRLAGKDLLWVTGKDDTAYTPTYAEALRARLRTSGANLQTHDLDAGHELMEPAADLVRTWLTPRL